MTFFKVTNNYYNCAKGELQTFSYKRRPKRQNLLQFPGSLAFGFLYADPLEN